MYRMAKPIWIVQAKAHAVIAFYGLIVFASVYVLAVIASTR
jgi:hypothetical protein